MDDLQGDHKCNMILGRDIFYKLQIYKCFSDNTIRGNGGTYGVCMAPMKDIPNNNFNASSVWIHEKRFWNKELWEINM